MILSRHSFFILLLAVILLPIPLYKLAWLAGTRKTTGSFYFTGHGDLGSVLGITTYPVIRFRDGKDTIIFNGNVNIPLKPEEIVPVRYRTNNPSDAKVNTFICIWGDTLAYEAGPFLILLIVFFHPNLVPKNAKVKLGKKRGIEFI